MVAIDHLLQTSKPQELNSTCSPVGKSKVLYFYFSPDTLHLVLHNCCTEAYMGIMCHKVHFIFQIPSEVKDIFFCQ